MRSRLAPLVLLSMLLAACAGDRPLRGESSGNVVGLLQYSDPENCERSDGCGPEFGIVDSDFSALTPLYGKLKPEHHNLVISVQGRQTSVDRADADFLGGYSAGKAYRVKRYRLLTSIPYHQFLVEQASAYTSGTFGCDLLWDKTFAWRRVNDRVQLLVRMTDTLGNLDPAPYLELAYDGQSGHLVDATVMPEGMNPCAP